MKFASVATVFLSLSLGAQARPEIANVDPENYESKEVGADVARGGIRNLKKQGVLSFKREEEANNKRKGNLRKLQTGNWWFDDDYYTQPEEAMMGTGLDDDQLVTEELLTIEYYQDNRFSNPAPVWADTNEQTAMQGNRWLYANVPLQPIFGINDLPIQGLAQGFCEALDDVGNGMCHFTYEFFELTNGAIVVYASITAEGTTSPQGPSTLNILGGTGEFTGAVGEITLVPVGIDESIVPARIFNDGSMFLGNMNGYDAKFDVSIRYLINEPPPVPVPVQMPVPSPVASFQVAATSVDNLLCPGEVASEYCDCDLDCNTGSSRCACEAAKVISCCGKA